MSAQEEQLEGAAAAGSKHARASPAEEAPSEAPATAEPASKKQRHEEGEEQGGAAEGGGAEAGAGKAGGEADAAGGKAGTAASEANIIEQGRIQFFYRPKVEKDEVGSLADVQRFFMLLRPDKEGVKSRLCVLGKKRLPSARRHERFFGFVESTSLSADELLEGLGPQSYETKTRGTRHLAGARAVGQGTYAIVDHPDRVTLVYKLEVPASPGEAQLEFTIGEAGSFIFSAKNPAGRGAGDPGLDKKAEYPPEKQEEFQHYSWIPVRDPQLLEYERCEFLLIGVRSDEELAEQLPLAEGSQRVLESGCGAESDEECLLQSMREEMQAEKHGISTEPAETGELA